MKILFVTPERPGEFSGGQIAVKQSLVSLAEKHTIIYVGPYCEGLSQWTEDQHFFEAPSKVDRLRAFFKGETSIYYPSWMRIKEQIDWNAIDLVFLEFTKYDFVAEEAKRRRKSLVVRMHNVEHDYARNAMKLKKNLQKTLVYFLAKRKEASILAAASRVVCLTERDQERVREIYGAFDAPIAVVPICVEGSRRLPVAPREGNRLKVLISGSLWFGPNLEGVFWFLDQVYPVVKADIDLRIVGSNPAERLVEAVGRESHVHLFADVESMLPYYQWCDVVVQPIFSGAGMKVKVANALSFGLLQVLTPEAMVGYHLQDQKDCFVADKKESVVAALQRIVEMNDEDLEAMRKSAYERFRESYSLESSRGYYSQLI